MDDKLVVVGQYENPEMAHIDRIALEDAEIHAVLENENLSAVSLYHVIPHCEVRLLVSKNDAEKALQILNEIQDLGPIADQIDMTPSMRMKNNCMSVDEKLVVIAQYDKAEMAHIDRIALEGAGIETFMNEENIVSANWFYTIFAGGIKLVVRQNDLERAQQILQDIRDNPAVDENDQPIFDKDEDFVCPACGSTKIDFETYSRKWLVFSILFLKFPLPVKTNRAVCRQCGHKWKQL